MMINEVKHKDLQQKIVTTNHRTGRVALLGEPNTGKSSIVNAIVGEDVSIVSDKAGTTRDEIIGIKSGENYQIIFLDTPGMLKKQNLLDKAMAKSISNAVASADVILYVLDATDIRDEYIRKIENHAGKKPIIIAVNKTDRSTHAKLYPKLGRLNVLQGISAIVPVSAKTNFNIDVLEDEIAKALPQGDAQYEEDDFTTQATRKMAEEIIREQLLHMLRAELPHGIAVKIMNWKETSKQIEINAEIYCINARHKPMIIGKKGSVLKQVGIGARARLQELTGKHVKLYTHVLVREDWKNKKEFVESL